MAPNEQSVLDFLKAVENRQSSDDIASFYHPDIVQIEYPNAIVKETAIRAIQDLKDGAERGSKLLLREAYEVENLYSFGDTVILEAIWRGTLAIPVGNIPAGGQMIANFAQFFVFKDGKIFRQRNYDCFQPF